MPTEDELKAKLKLLGAELDVRAKRHAELESYRSEKGGAIPPAIKHAKVTTAYRMLMSISSTNYAKQIVKAAASKMRVGGIKTGDDELDRQIWGIWQDNRMNAEFRRATDSILTHGRCFAIVRPGQGGEPEIILEDSATVIVEYAEGSRYNRVAGLRRWTDSSKVLHGTLYYPDATYRFKTNRKVETASDRETLESVNWVLDGDPLPNAYGTVPAIEISTNGGLKPGRFGAAQGDYETELGLLDRINTLEFLRLVIAFTASFPVRVVIGEKILRDDDDKPIAPFELGADIIAQLENPAAKLEEFKAADLEKFGQALDRDIEVLAGVTGTPLWQLKSNPVANVNTETIRASNMPLDARVSDHLPFIAEGAEEILRVAGRMKGLDVPQSASLQWVNRESYSLSERADAATKLKDVLPWQAVASEVLDMDQEQIGRIEQLRAADVLTGLLTEPDAVPVD